MAKEQGTAFIGTDGSNKKSKLVDIMPVTRGAGAGKGQGGR